MQSRPPNHPRNRWTHCNSPSALRRRRAAADARREAMAAQLPPIPADPAPGELWQRLVAIEQAPQPTTDDWRVVSDAVNLMETLVELGVLEDGQGLLQDAVAGMAMAGKRAMQGGAIRLDGQGIRAVRAILEDYAEAIAVLPARAMVRAHRKTEARILDILTGRRRPHDVEVVDL